MIKHDYDISKSYTVAIVGGGVAGIISLKHAIEQNLNPTLFECNNELGGVWSTKYGKTWNVMNTNVSQYSVQFSDYYWDIKKPTLVHNKDVIEYLNNYIAHFNLNKYTKLSTKVIDIERLPNKKWNIKTLNLKDNSTYTSVFDKLIIASGVHNKYYYPNYKGLFDSYTGEVIHAGKFKDEKQYKGKKVLIIGSSYSGISIAETISVSNDQSVYLSQRSSTFILKSSDFSKYLKSNINTDISKEKVEIYNNLVDDMPMDFLSPMFKRTPNIFMNKIYSDEELKTEKYNFDPEDSKSNYSANFQIRDSYQLNFKEKYINTIASLKSITNNNHNIPSLKIKDNTKINIAFSDRAFDLVENRKIIIKPAIKSLGTDCNNRKLVFFEDNTVEEIDVVICCTGYRTNLEDIFKSNNLNNIQNEVLETIKYNKNSYNHSVLLYKGLFHPDISNLCFISLASGLFWSGIELQARYATMLLSGNIDYPSKERTDYILKLEEKAREYLYFENNGVSEFNSNSKNLEATNQVIKIDTENKKYADKFPISYEFNDYCESLSSEIGVRPNYNRIKEDNPELYKILIELPVLSANYVLFGPNNKYDKAYDYLKNVYRYLKKLGEVSCIKSIDKTAKNMDIIS